MTPEEFDRRHEARMAEIEAHRRLTDQRLELLERHGEESDRRVERNERQIRALARLGQALSRRVFTALDELSRSQRVLFERMEELAERLEQMGERVDQMAARMDRFTAALELRFGNGHRPPGKSD